MTPAAALSAPGAPAYTLYRRTGHVPMRVVARLDDAIGYLGDLLHLDAPIAYAVYHDLDEATRKTIPPLEAGDFPLDFYERTPLSTWWTDYDPVRHGEVDTRLLKRRGRGVKTVPQLWGWCATAADESAWEHRGKREIRKRPDLGRLVRYTDARKFDVGAGHMKAYDLTIPTVLSRQVEWYAYGDPDKVRALLSRFVPVIGKKRNLGLGGVREWLVEPVDDEVSDGVCVRGRLARRLPAGEAGPVRFGAIRPPYYHHSRVVAAVEPC